MNVLHFLLFWINTVIHVLSKAPIQEVIGRANPKFYRKHQSKNLPDFGNAKNKCTFLYRDVFVFAQHFGMKEKTCNGAGRNYPL